jgi:hypothetical protein
MHRIFRDDLRYAREWAGAFRPVHRNVAPMAQRRWGCVSYTAYRAQHHRLSD